MIFLMNSNIHLKFKNKSQIYLLLVHIICYELKKKLEKYIADLFIKQIKDHVK